MDWSALIIDVNYIENNLYCYFKGHQCSENCQKERLKYSYFYLESCWMETDRDVPAKPTSCDGLVSPMYWHETNRESLKKISQRSIY